MKSTARKPIFRSILLPLASIAIVADVSAHGDMEWNEFTIDSKNDSVQTSIEHVKDVIADIILRRREVSEWPDPELLRAEDELKSLKEDVDDMLNHLREDGVRLQLTKSLRAHPRAGRAVAGSHAIEVGIDLLRYIASRDSPAAFEEELHEGGMGAYMFDLMDAYADTMGLYKELTERSTETEPDQP